jgi:hypothetical protein
MSEVSENSLRLVQFTDEDGGRQVGLVTSDGGHLRPLAGFERVYDLAQQALRAGRSLAALAHDFARDARVDYAALLAEGRVLAPLDHPEPARLLVTGTGLTHTGSADARNRMHVLNKGEGEESDSLKIFRMGLEGGKPGPGKIGVQPEWFFKGVGTCVVAPGAVLPLPGFALAGAEEPEIVGLYILDDAGLPRRIGYTLGNDFSDHVTEGQNYLYLAHSKLRACSMGPELLVGELPQEVLGTSRVWRDGKVIWQDAFISGEAHMSHSIANLEHFHFRYPMHRRPGDLHAYFFGASAMSYAAGVRTEPGDEFEFDVPVFGKPLRNRMERVPDEGFVGVTPL